MKSGQRSYVPGIGYIAIVSVEPVELTHLTDDDAVLDGFPSVELLRDEIRTLYTAEIQANLIPFRVRFSVYSPREQQEMTEERQRQKQQNPQQNRDAYQQEVVMQTLDKLRKMSEMDEAG